MANASPVPPPGSITSQEIARFRLARHHLLPAKPVDSVAIARDACGMQAQVMSAAFLQLWTRNHRITRGDVEQALWQERSLVRASLMRQTLHLVPSDQFPIYIAAVRSGRVAAVLRIMARFKISPDEANDFTGLIMETLSAGPLSHVAIARTVRPKVSKRVRAWMAKVSSVVRLPLVEGLICYSPGEGNQATFIRVDQWLGRQAPVAEVQARVELLRRYLRAYGPATLTDFAHWSGMPATEVRPLPALLAGELAEVKVENTVCMLLREDLDVLCAGAESGDCVRLLPHFDPYLLAHRGKDHLVEARHYKRVYRRQWWISPVLLINGIVAGVWSCKHQGRKRRVTIESFAKLSRAARAAVAQEAEELAGFFGSQLELVI